MTALSEDVRWRRYGPVRMDELSAEDPEQIATAKQRAQDWKIKNRLVVRPD